MAGLGGRLLGLEELFLLAAGGGALLLCAVAYVWVRRFTVYAQRTLTSGKVPAGGSCRVELAITNRGRWTTPVLGLEDGSRGRFLLDPVGRSEKVPATYQFGAARRGLHAVGPLCVQLRDPFGLASRSVAALAPSTLTVHPRVEPVELPDLTGASGGGGGPRRSTPSHLPGEDFHALRPYVEGDDLRLVHWPTSARLDTLVVRQDETPLLRQTLVVLDLRRSVHDDATLERAVSVAASVTAAACGDEGLARLVTTGGVDSGSAGGEGHLASVLDTLATVTGDASPDLQRLASVLDQGEGATVVLITTTAAAAGHLGALARLRLTSPLMVAVVLAAASRRRPAPEVEGLLLFDRVVTVAPGTSFAEAWAGGVPGLLPGR